MNTNHYQQKILIFAYRKVINMKDLGSTVAQW